MEEENKLACQLKLMCDKNGKEVILQSSAVLHKLAQVYCHRLCAGILKDQLS